jgi:hypothetical protein
MPSFAGRKTLFPETHSLYFSAVAGGPRRPLATTLLAVYRKAVDGSLSIIY